MEEELFGKTQEVETRLSISPCAEPGLIPWRSNIAHICLPSVGCLRAGIDFRLFGKGRVYYEHRILGANGVVMRLKSRNIYYYPILIIRDVPCLHLRFEDG